jgi:hypothetical protein
LWVSLVSFATITFCVASQQVFSVVVFIINSVWKLLDTPLYKITFLLSYWGVYVDWYEVMQYSFCFAILMGKICFKRYREKKNVAWYCSSNNRTSVLWCRSVTYFEGINFPFNLKFLWVLLYQFKFQECLAKVCVDVPV